MTCEEDIVSETRTKSTATHLGREAERHASRSVGEDGLREGKRRESEESEGDLKHVDALSVEEQGRRRRSRARSRLPSLHRLSSA